MKLDKRKLLGPLFAPLSRAKHSRASRILIATAWLPSQMIRARHNRPYFAVDISSSKGMGAVLTERWMYDQYGLTHLFMKAGFSDCKSLAYNESSIPDFQKDCLDNNPDGSYRKGNSIYLEASKPLNNPSTSFFTR